MDKHLGLDSISFDTLGLDLMSGDAGSRIWQGNGIALSEHFFPIPPDFPSLEVEDLRRTYGGDSPAPPGHDRTLRIIELGVMRQEPLPIVRVLWRLPMSDWYAFLGALTLPLAGCSWVVKAQANEGNPTGLREALAFDAALGQHPGRSLEDVQREFDPYDSRWDDLYPNDPLTDVRRVLRTVQESLQYRAEVAEQTAFR